MSYKQIQFRRGTSAEWLETNPVLLAGEVGYERDVPAGIGSPSDGYSYSDAAYGVGAIKIGDGVTRWADLPYLLTSLRLLSTSTSSVDAEFVDIKTGDVIRWSNGKWRNYPETTLLDGGNF